VLRENKIFENKKETVLVLKESRPWKHQNAISKNRAFFPEHQMKNYRSPNTKEMVDAYRKVKSNGLKNIRLGNLGVFIHNDKDRDYLMANIDMSAL
jgi:hypothetical protein